MGNWDRNVQGARRDARLKEFEAKQKSKEDKQKAKTEERKAKLAEQQKQLLEGIVADLDASEEQVYHPLFEQLLGEGHVFVEDPLFLHVLVEHTDISVVKGTSKLVDALGNWHPNPEELAETKGAVSFSGFLSLLRENSVSDSAALATFLEIGHGLETISSAEAKAHVLHLAKKQVKHDIEKEKWDVLVASVMAEAESQIGPESFIKFAKKLSRCARLLDFLETSQDVPDVGPSEFAYWQRIAADVERQRGSRRAQGHPETAARLDPPSDKSHLPAVAFKCSLCLACGDVCSYHIHLKKRMSDDVKAGSSGDGQGSTSSQGFGNVLCDMCKSSGMLCFYHSQATKLPNRRGTGGSTASSSSGTNGIAACGSAFSGTASGSSSGATGSGASGSASSGPVYVSTSSGSTASGSAIDGSGTRGFDHARPGAPCAMVFESNRYRKETRICDDTEPSTTQQVAELRREVAAAVSTKDADRLAETIFIAAEAGVDEDELLPAFECLELLRIGVPIGAH